MANLNAFSRPAEGHKLDMFIKIGLALGFALLVLWVASEWHKGADARALGAVYDHR